MPQPTVNPQRFDPYRNFKFRISWDGHCVAGASKMSGFNRKAITLERGITHDPEFERWTHGLEAFDADPARELSNAVALEKLTLQNGGWERDDSDAAPPDPFV